MGAVNMRLDLGNGRDSGTRLLVKLVVQEPPDVAVGATSVLATVDVDHTAYRVRGVCDDLQVVAAAPSP